MCAPRAVRPRRRGSLGHRHRQLSFRGREAPLLHPTCWPPASWLICEAGPESPPQPAPRGAPLWSPPWLFCRRLRAVPPAPPRATAAPSQAAPKPITSLHTSSHTCRRTQVKGPLPVIGLAVTRNSLILMSWPAITGHTQARSGFPVPCVPSASLAVTIYPSTPDTTPASARSYCDDLVPGAPRPQTHCPAAWLAVPHRALSLAQLLPAYRALVCPP
ncbi:hypothetical protein LEMLEM_LOCUS17752 [Lemmus lemmus]